MPDEIVLNIPNTREGYELFIKSKALPKYRIDGRKIITDEKSYNYVFGGKDVSVIPYVKNGIEFDYQEWVIKKALERERYAAFLDCGLGKTIIELVFIHNVINKIGGKGLILCPLSVLEDIQIECQKIYGYKMSCLRNNGEWKTDIAIINYEGMKEINMRGVVCVVLDESSILKNGDGETRKYLTELVANVRFRLACSATPSPNDQTEYASHAVWVGISNTLKEFYSKFFVKDGIEWRMKAHATDAFYDFLKSWACYIQSPSALGFERGAELSHEPNYIIQESYPDPRYLGGEKMFSDQIELKLANRLFTELRSDTKEERFINAIKAIKHRRGIVWCSRNNEEDAFARELNAIKINGSTPIEKRVDIVNDFRAGRIKHIVSKPSVLGFGVNIPQAEAHLYSGYTFSFEEFYQAVRRSHRYGRKGTLDVIVPVSEPETPIWDSLQRKLNTFKKDVKELQGRFFK